MQNVQNVVNEMGALDRTEIAEIENMMHADFIAPHTARLDAVSDEIEASETDKPRGTTVIGVFFWPTTMTSLGASLASVSA